MGKKYTTDELEVGGHMLDASMMGSLNTVVTNSPNYMTSLPSHTHTWASITSNSVNGWGGLRHTTPSGYIDFGPANSSHAHIYTGSPNFYLNKSIQVLGVSIMNQNDIRSKIFYDVDNTGYYLHPASTSNFNTLNVSTINRNPVITLSGDVSGSATMTNLGSINITATVNDDSHKHSFIQAGGAGPSTEDLNTVADSVLPGQLSYRGYNSSSTNKPPTSDNANGVISVGQHNGGYSAQVAFSSNGNMYWRDNPSSSYGSWRTLWDSSNFTNNSANWNTAYGWGDHAGLYAAASHNHAQYIVEGGTSFSGVYPMVVRVGATSYYSDQDITFTGASSQLYVGGSVRTPILYDSNNTAYYLNPAGDK